MKTKNPPMLHTVSKTRQPRQPRERLSLFMNAGSIATATLIANKQSAANPTKDVITLSAVLREAISIGLKQLEKKP